MSSLIQTIKNDLIINGEPNWPSILYALATPIGILACAASMRLGYNLIQDPSKFHMANYWIALTSTFVFACKIPYALNKPLALMAFVINLIGWFIASIIMSIALDKHIKYQTQQKIQQKQEEKTIGKEQESNQNPQNPQNPHQKSK